MDFVTAEEKADLERKLQDLVDNRPAISQRIAEARALGDLKENGDYHAAKEEQGIQEAEIKRLTDRLSRVSVVDDAHKGMGIVFVGATVRIQEVEEDDKKKGAWKPVDDPETVRLVGEATGNMTGDVFEATLNSPFGEALLKARVGDVVSVRGPRGMKKFEVKEIV